MFGKKSEPEAEKKQGFVGRLRARLNRGDSWLTYDLANLVPGGRIDEDVLEELEAQLVMADTGTACALCSSSTGDGERRCTGNCWQWAPRRLSPARWPPTAIVGGTTAAWR